MKKNYLSLAILVIIAGVLDYYCLSNLGKEVVASYRADTLTQLFTGTGWDWIGLFAFNIVAILTGVFLAKEQDFYEESPKAIQFGILIVLIASLLAIAWG